MRSIIFALSCASLVGFAIWTVIIIVRRIEASVRRRRHWRRHGYKLS